MKHLLNRYYLAGTTIAVYLEVQALETPGIKNCIRLMDVESNELIFVGEKWQEYTPKEGEILIPLHKTVSTPIHVGFRQFWAHHEIMFHADCSLVYNHGYGRNLTVVKCQHCEQEFIQGINTGECVPLNYNPSAYSGKFHRCETYRE